MKFYKIPLENGESGHYNILKADDVEFVNPISYYTEVYIKQFIITRKDILKPHHLPISESTIEDFLLKEAIKEWNYLFEGYLNKEIPINFIKLLTSHSKKEQTKLLKNQALTTGQLMSFIFKAYSDFDFSFSQYIGEHHHNNLDVKNLPTVIEVNEKGVEIVGKTSLSDGQLKQVVDHQKRTTATFLDNKNEWHCFFVTNKSLKGEENWKEGQPHFHYLSDKFGLKREYVKDILKSRTYNLGSLPHIDLLGYKGRNK